MKFSNIGIYSRFEPGTETMISHQYFDVFIGNHKNFPNETFRRKDKILNYNGYFPISKTEYDTLISNIKALGSTKNWNYESHYNEMCVGFFERGFYAYNMNGIRLFTNILKESYSWQIIRKITLPNQTEEVKSIIKNNSIIDNIDQKIIAAEIMVYSQNNEPINGVEGTTCGKLKEYVKSKEEEYIFKPDELLQFLPKIDWHPYNR